MQNKNLKRVEKNAQISIKKIKRTRIGESSVPTQLLLPMLLLPLPPPSSLLHSIPTTTPPQVLGTTIQKNKNVYSRHLTEPIDVRVSTILMQRKKNYAILY